ncbi:MAG: hypothetical protein O7G84_13645 [Gammaproteobacteria bacterium]|nr:hypothetical protein [Gammaproteobacteria bacterium]
MRPALTGGQRDAANYGGAEFTVYNDIRRGGLGMGWINIAANHDPAADDRDLGWAATAFWRARAGLKHPWHGDETEGNAAPKLAKPAPRKPREKPRRDELHAALSVADRKVAAKQKHLNELQKRKKSAEAAARTATRRIGEAIVQLAQFEIEARDARARVLAMTETPRLSDNEYAARMRMKRETEGEATCV